MATTESNSSGTSSRNRSRGFAIGGVVLLGIWVFLLRGPSLDIPVWNVDETIHATVADVLLDGGTLYRDAIDQRSPLTYYATAAVFAVTGPSLPALRFVIMLMIIAAAAMLGRVAGRTGGVGAAVGTAGVFVAFSNYLLSATDTFAAHTEWFVVFFTVAAAWCFLGGSGHAPSLKRCGSAGLCLGFAAMSKQTALLDLAPAIVGLLVLSWDRFLHWRALLVRIAALLGGFAAGVVLLIGPSLLSGAGADLLYYTWTYNLQIYGAEYTFVDKVLSAIRLIEALGETYPLLVVFGTLSAVAVLVRVLQIRPSEGARSTRVFETYFLVWLITSVGGGMAGGRGFDHYFFPTFAPLAWFSVWSVGRLMTTILARRDRPRWLKALTYVAVIGVVFSFVVTPWAARKTPPPPPDPALPIAAWMKAHSTREDRVFVWGFNPDIYHYTNRLPASRFLYCIFQTGLIPWTNTDPFVDTNYAIVPGSMDTLLADLERHPPRFFIDSSVGPHRFFGKYPVRNFPALEAWLRDHYAEVDPARFAGHGFRIYLRADEAIDVAPDRLAIDPAAPVGLDGYDRMSGGLNQLRVDYHHHNSAGNMTGLGLIRDGEIIAGMRLRTDESVNLKFPIVIAEETETVEFEPIIQIDDGPWIRGAAQTGAVASAKISADQKIDFAVPLLGERVNAIGLRAFFGARAETLDGQRIFSMHAPALLNYEISAPVKSLSGKFGLPPGAYAEDNPAPSDGAEFIIRLVSETKPPRELFRRLINPRANEWDRAEQDFEVDLTEAQPGDVVELEITAGPAGVASSDWTYWADLLFETSL